jgi:hypothetical protein
MAYVAEQQDDFSGGASLYARVANPKMCLKLEHCRVDRDGSVTARGGSIRTTSTPVSASTCYGLAVFADAGGTTRYLVLLGAEGFTATSVSSWTSTIAGLAGAYADFAQFKSGAVNYLLWVNGTDAHYYTGAADGAIAGIPAGAKYICEANGRLWAAGHDGNTVVGSKLFDFTTYAVPQGISLQIGDSRPITGIEEVGGTVLVFKADETARINGYGSDIVVAAGDTGESRSVGCVNFRTICSVGDAGLMWLSRRGIELYNPQSGQIQCVTNAIAPFFVVESIIPRIGENALVNGPRYAHSYFDTGRQEYHLLVEDQAARQSRVVVNVQTGAVYVWPSIAGEPSFDAGAPLFGAVVMARFAPPTASLHDFYPLAFTGDTGYPVALEYGTRDMKDELGSGGTAFSGKLRSRSFTRGDAIRRKWVRQAYASVRNKTGAALTPTIAAVNGIGTAGTAHSFATTAIGEKEIVAGVSVRSAAPCVEVTIPPGMALDAVGIRSQVLVQGTR